MVLNYKTIVGIYRCLFTSVITQKAHITFEHNLEDIHFGANVVFLAVQSRNKVVSGSPTSCYIHLHAYIIY